MSREAAVYFIHRKKKVGPFSVKELRRQVASGNISREALVWYKGLEEWTALKDAFSEDIEIPDTPRSRNGATDLSLIRDEVPALPKVFPDVDSPGWSGPGTSGGKLFIPGDSSPDKEAHLSTPEWEIREAKRVTLKRKWPQRVALRVVIIAALLWVIYLCW